MSDQPLMGHAAFHYDPNVKKRFPDIVHAAGVLSSVVAERDQLRADLARLHEICDQRDKAEAELARERELLRLWLLAWDTKGAHGVFLPYDGLVAKTRLAVGDAMAKEAK